MPRDPVGTRLPVSLEMTPRHAIEIADLDRLFPAGTRVYLTDLGTDRDDRFAVASLRLREAGYVPVPHLAVRRLASTEACEARLSAFATAGVKDALVVAGGVSRPAGPFASTLDLLRTGRLEAAGIRRIGVAGHPEGCPDIAPDEIRRALAEKNDYATRSGSDLHIVTQFGFDARVMIDWALGLAGEGNLLPIHLGIAGPARVTTLLKYAAMCGVGASVSFLKRRAGALASLTTSFSPEAVAEPIESWWAKTPGAPVTYLHVYPFGGVAKCAEWLRERGSWPAQNETESEGKDCSNDVAS